MWTAAVSVELAILGLKRKREGEDEDEKEGEKKKTGTGMEEKYKMDCNRQRKAFKKPPTEIYTKKRCQGSSRKRKLDSSMRA
jgi:hypothetical protein